MAKKSINNLNLADGKEEKFVPSTLDQIWGETSNSYSTNDVDEYTKELQEMNSADLHAHAIKRGLLPTTSRERTLKRLVLAFKQHAAANRVLPVPKAKKAPTEDIRKILSEGR